MSFENLHNTIRGHFKSTVEDIIPIPTVYDNAPDIHPDDSLWAKVSIVESFTEQIQFGGNPAYRTVGNVHIQLFEPIKGGDQSVLNTADIVVSAFRAVTVSGVRFRVPTIRAVGRNGSWWQINVICPFQCDDTV